MSKVKMGGIGSGRRPERKRDVCEDTVALDVRSLVREGYIEWGRTGFGLPERLHLPMQPCGAFFKSAQGYQRGWRRAWQNDLFAREGHILVVRDGPRLLLAFRSYLSDDVRPLAWPLPQLERPRPRFVCADSSQSTVRGLVDVAQPLQLTATPCHMGGHRLWLLCPCCQKRVAIVYLRLIHERATGAVYGLNFFACRGCLKLVYESQYEDAGARSRRRAAQLKWQLGAPLTQVDMEYPIPPRPPRMSYARYRRMVFEILWRQDVFLQHVKREFLGYELQIEAFEERREKARLKRLRRKKRREMTTAFKVPVAVNLETKRGFPVTKKPKRSPTHKSVRKAPKTVTIRTGCQRFQERFGTKFRDVPR